MHVRRIKDFGVEFAKAVSECSIWKSHTKVPWFDAGIALMAGVLQDDQARGLGAVFPISATEFEVRGPGETPRCRGKHDEASGTGASARRGALATSMTREINAKS